ncbi:hypothetical protein [Streptosporangium sp. NPDC023615]|uniref:hypothetical protein n=1 Tax=Streptosporangium sp. NPDC023615 TaxID=3154794 RepID=UPI00343C9A02
MTVTVVVAGAVPRVGDGTGPPPRGAVVAVAAAPVIVAGVPFTGDLASLLAPAFGPACS